MAELRGTILIVEDEEPHRKRAVEQFHDRFEILQAHDCSLAQTVLRESRVDLLLLDLFLPDGSGWKVARLARRLYPEVSIVVMSGSKSFDNAIEAFNNEALYFFTKNWRNRAAVRRLSGAVDRGVRDAIIRRRARASSARIERQKEEAEPLVADSSAMKVVMARIEEAGRSDLPVLIEGPTGSGKEVVARAIHNKSAFFSGPFVPVNISSLTPTMIEAELFGHVEGAFTGATGARAGYFEEADHGTIFLDEIGDMLLDLQVKLLRVLETREFSPVGCTRRCKVDLRVIAATNRPLRKRIEEGTFRDDLFFRLNGIGISVPPLHDRGEDIPYLARHFLLSCVHKIGKDLPRQLDPDAMELVVKARWKGNARELRTVMERIAYNCDEPVVSADFIREMTGIGADDEQTAYSCDPGLNIKENLRMLEASMVKDALGKAEGNISKAARLSAESYTTFRSRIKRLGIGR